MVGRIATPPANHHVIDVAKAAVLRAHAALGLIVLAFTSARLGWWLLDVKPAIAAGTRPFLSMSARPSCKFYVVVLGMAASGIAAGVVRRGGSCSLVHPARCLTSGPTHLACHMASALGLLSGPDQYIAGGEAVIARVGL